MTERLVFLSIFVFLAPSGCFAQRESPHMPPPPPNTSSTTGIPTGLMARLDPWTIIRKSAERVCQGLRIVDG